MLLKELDGLYDRLRADPEYRIAPPGFSLQKISFKVILKPDGELFAIQDARHLSGTKMVPKQMLVPGNSKSTGSGLNPCYFWDNAKYMLGFTSGEDVERTAKSFEAFRKHHLDVEHEVGSSAFSTVCRFLEKWDPSEAKDNPILDDLATGIGVFQLQGEQRFVHEDESVLQWWQTHNSTESEGESGYCLVTGKRGPIARTHNKIKGVTGGQSSGCTIVGFNEPAYESYGRTQSYNAPVGKETAFRYVTALNALLDGPMRTKHRVRLADTTVAFWTDKPSVAEDIFAGLLYHGSAGANEDQVQDESLLRKLHAYLDALRKGLIRYREIEDDPENTGYNLLGLAPNAARISIRFHLKGTLSELLEKQQLHYRDMAIEPDRVCESDPLEFPSIRMLLDETCPRPGGKPDRDKISPVLSGPLTRSIITGANYPDGFYGAVIGRLRVDRRLHRVRAGIIKGYLNRNKGKEVGMSLDVNRPDPAYRLGRLFAALEKTQSDALGSEINSTIRDRFYASASATPQTVFPRLMRTYQHHLAKMAGGRKVNREKLIQEIIDPLDGFPARFDLTDQGLFAIGYYHQTRDFYQKNDNNKTDGSNERNDR